MMFPIDFTRSMPYFPQVVHILRLTYQQVCDVKLALIGSQNCDCSGHSSCITDRVTSLFFEFKSLFSNSVSVNGISYISGR